MKYISRLLIVFIIVLAAVTALQYPKLNIISGYASKYMVSEVFIAGREPTSVAETDLKAPLIEYATATVDTTAMEAEAAVYGLMNRKAVFRKGLGGVLLNDHSQLEADLPVPYRSHSFDSLPYPLGHLPARDTVFPEIDYQKLEAAVTQAFDQPEKQKTRTLLILYKDHLVSERYIEGFGPNTPVLGWSMTKSVLATLYGILEHRDEIDLDSPVPVASWQGDARKNITFNHLLRMQSGLSWDEDYTKISDVTRMLFLSDDMSRIQENKKAQEEPGAIWNYSSGTSNLLSGLLRQYFPTYQDYLNFPYRELIDRIGMNSMLLETDLSGNFVGSSYGWASTRDWGKFGLLYLHEGNWNGQQLFDSTWVQYVTTPTKFSEGTYGAHFWLNAEGKYPGVPRDLYSANGYEGQYVFIIPSKHLVIVRTGLAEPPDFDLNSFLREVVTAFP